MNRILLIDTSDSQRARIELSLGGQRVERVSQVKGQRAQTVLPLIEQILKENNLKLRDITEIKVHTGPGSFTGLRVGIAIANMLGMLLHIPVNGQPAGRVTTPAYNRSKFDTYGS